MLVGPGASSAGPLVCSLCISQVDPPALPCVRTVHDGLHKILSIDSDFNDKSVTRCHYLRKKLHNTARIGSVNRLPACARARWQAWLGIPRGNVLCDQIPIE